MNVPGNSSPFIFPQGGAFRKGDIFKIDNEHWPKLSPDQLVQILEIEELRPISPIKGKAGSPVALPSDTIQVVPGAAARKVNAETFNPIFQCQSAKMSDHHLVAPDGKPWKLGKASSSSLLIRDAYKDHWAIIKANFDNPATAQPVFISGTPGIGKSIEGYYIIHQIFENFSEPPIIFVPTKSQKKCIIHLYGRYYSHPNFSKFINTGIYELIVTHFSGNVWHICDTVSPNLQTGFQDFGPLIIISSLGRVQKEMKDINAVDTLTLYLPLPTIEEMRMLRALHLQDQTTPAVHITETKMNELIRKYGCIPRTVFEFGNNKSKLDAIEKKFGAIEDVERMLNMVGGSVIDRDVASGSFFHMLPCLPAEADIETKGCAEAKTGDETAEADQASKAGKGDKTGQERSAVDAGMAQTGSTTTEQIARLKALYTNIVYMWGSEYIRDIAFDRFLTLSPDRMMQIVLNHQKSPGSVRRLLLEPFVDKLLTECGVIGRMKNLETQKFVGSTFRLGPWKSKHIYQNHSEISLAEGVYNVPAKRNEVSIDAIVPSEGYLFQVMTSPGGHGINRLGLDTLMKSNPFRDFTRNHHRSANIKFVWIVEAGNFDTYVKQNYHGTNKKAYQDHQLKTTYPGVDQYVFEIDIRRIYQFHSTLKVTKPVNMTKKVDELQKKLKTYGIGSSKSSKAPTSTSS